MNINKKRISFAIGFILLAIGYYFFNKLTGFSIDCPFHTLTNLYCPGCGITRMLFSLFNLEIYQAFRYNILVFTLVLICIIKFLYSLILKKDFVFSNKTVMIMLIITILFGIVRNLEAFKFLAPTNI